VNNRTRKSFTPEFRLEVAQLVVNQGSSIREAADAMSVGKSTVDKWVRQLKDELSGVSNIKPKPYIGSSSASFNNASITGRFRSTSGL